NNRVQRYIKTEMAITISQKQHIANVRYVRYIYRASKRKRARFTSSVLKEGNRMSHVIAKRQNVDNVVECLKSFNKAFPEVLKHETLSVVTAYMNSAALTQPPYVYGLVTQKRKQLYDISITCRLKEPLLCDVSIAKRIS
ncbi:hypothetical protein LOTGIDRAFT_177020, partial [Lottia gigantea]